MVGLFNFDPRWEATRSESDVSRVYTDASILIATDFEGGNGNHFRCLGNDCYAIDLEPEPGQHRFSGTSYYYCFAITNRLPVRRRVDIKLYANPPGSESFGKGIEHAVIRRGEQWSQLSAGAIRPAEDGALIVSLTLPGAKEPDCTLFVSDFHWWPYSEVMDYIRDLAGGTVREIGRSQQGRPILAVEIGPAGAPCMVHAATPQPSEMGHLCCKAMIDYLLSDDAAAADMRQRFRFCFVPVTNPDGAVLGYGVSDARGGFPYFEGQLAADGDLAAPPAMSALWQYLVENRPWLYWEWHSNNWARRPGHMLLRYRHDLLTDSVRREAWDMLEDRLLLLDHTHHGNWTSRDEGLYQPTIGFEAVTRLGAIACMIKQHDRFSLEISRSHAVDCLKAATEVFGAHS